MRLQLTPKLKVLKKNTPPPFKEKVADPAPINTEVIDPIVKIAEIPDQESYPTTQPAEVIRQHIEDSLPPPSTITGASENSSEPEPIKRDNPLIAPTQELTGFIYEQSLETVVDIQDPTIHDQDQPELQLEMSNPIITDEALAVEVDQILEPEPVESEDAVHTDNTEMDQLITEILEEADSPTFESLLVAPEPEVTTTKAPELILVPLPTADLLQKPPVELFQDVQAKLSLPEASPALSEVVIKIEEALAHLDASSQTNDIEPHLTPELTEAIIELFEVLGYEKPELLVEQYVAIHGSEALIESLRVLCKPAVRTETQEFLHFLPTVASDDQHLKLGQLLMQLIKRTTDALMLPSIVVGETG